MQKPNWQSLDFNIASDYTHGSPEYYRTILRQMLNIPKLLPGETDVTTQREFKSKNDNRFFKREKL
jgi:hypothetical protein